MAGHTFLVHGRTEALVHDAALVPTNDDFEIEPTWHPLLGSEDTQDTVDTGSLRPPGWPGPGYGRASDGRPVWFVSVAGLTTEELVARAIDTVRAMAGGDLSPGRNRVKPLLAVPILGIEGGGHNEDRGGVIRRLLEAFSEVIGELDVDIAVVTPERSVYGAAQHVRGQPCPAGFSKELLAEARRLGELARSGELALFFGAGVSVPAGLPTWREMLHGLAREAGIRAGDLDGLSPLDQAQLLQRRLPDIGRHVAAATDRHRRPSLAHALLAGLRCREAVTTNYDRLYETAVAATDRGAPRVLPWETAVGGRAWVLKLHGDVSEPASVTLTRRDFVRFDAHTGPAGALLQALLLTRHLLVVGASLADDNVVRLLREVEVFREGASLTGPLAAFLDVDDDHVRRELWQDQLAWSTMPGESLPERARGLEIFLDTLARYAADTSSWLLDPRFSGLLDEPARRAAERARALRDQLDDLGEEWARLCSALNDAGAPEHGA
jgi:hypothetical protein